MSRTTNGKTSGGRKLLRALMAIPVAGMLLAGGTVTAQAFTPDVIAQVHHFVECFGWMITDPAEHAAQCSPGYNPPYDPVTNRGSGYVPTYTITYTETM